ncbi:MAG: cytochrome c-type biogenesis protein CcmH [Clostridia bacterium]|jgi:cytochrome c-type biogenesis protein CcmH|nr:cytochrome c-type biogenesis protein CcmH [Clostridia bacterium]
MNLIGINRFKSKLILLVLVLFISAGPTWAFDPTHPDYQLYKEIENSLMCTDGCGMTLIACDNTTAIEMREKIRQFINEGIPKEDILQSFVAIYGLEVLTFPPKKGFNITAWVTPFVALLAGGLTIYLALDKWVFNHEEYDLDQDDEVSHQEIDLEDYVQILEKEQKKYL